MTDFYQNRLIRTFDLISLGSELDRLGCAAPITHLKEMRFNSLQNHLFYCPIEHDRLAQVERRIRWLNQVASHHN